MFRTPSTPNSLNAPELRDFTPRPKSPGIMSSNETIKIEDVENQNEEKSEESEITLGTINSKVI